MNHPYGLPIPDVQSGSDDRSIAIGRVGIKSIRHPMRIAGKAGGIQHTIGVFNMHVQLPPERKGTHMSRFVEILNGHDREISMASFEAILREMVDRLGVESGGMEISFPYFISNAAPVSGMPSLLDYNVSFMGEIVQGLYRFTMQVQVPVTSLCPCSREISVYGAHNQRSHVTVTARTRALVWIEDLVRICEENASCDLYGILKRADEKYVTEKAYDNPKFVEDIVRDVAVVLNADDRIEAYSIEVENFESIHNHSAYALIQRDKARR